MRSISHDCCYLPLPLFDETDVNGKAVHTQNAAVVGGKYLLPATVLPADNCERRNLRVQLK